MDIQTIIQTIQNILIQTIQDILLQSGIFAPLFLIFLQIVQVLTSFFPSYLLYLLSGFFFGAFWGTIYCLIGVEIGALLLFFLGKIGGQKLAKKIFGKKKMGQFQDWLKKKSLSLPLGLILAFLIPIFPNGLISFSAGLTKLKWWQFLLVSGISFILQILLFNELGAVLNYLV